MINTVPDITIEELQVHITWCIYHLIKNSNVLSKNVSCDGDRDSAEIIFDIEKYDKKISFILKSKDIKEFVE